MKPYFIKTPKLLTKLFNEYVWSLPQENAQVIYLTFDDGPIPEVTPWVLETLKKFQAQATFFCVGDNIAKHPKIFRQILDKNHRIGNHTFHHKNGWKTGAATYLEDVEKCNLEIHKHTTTNHKKFFRPPYGKITKKQSNSLIKNNYNIIMWDVLSADFDPNVSAEQCLSYIIKHTQSGSIIVLHDHLKTFDKLQFVLPRILHYFSEKGYSFKSLDLH